MEWRANRKIKSRSTTGGEIYRYGHKRLLPFQSSASYMVFPPINALGLTQIPPPTNPQANHIYIETTSCAPVYSQVQLLSLCSVSQGINSEDAPCLVLHCRASSSSPIFCSGSWNPAQKHARTRERPSLPCRTLKHSPILKLSSSKWSLQYIEAWRLLLCLLTLNSTWDLGFLSPNQIPRSHYMSGRRMLPIERNQGQ